MHLSIFVGLPDNYVKPRVLRDPEVVSINLPRNTFSLRVYID